ncbi:MAG: 5-formyltetrahydrofolate cyclo-ligase [Alkalispirochaeta sp.]
MKDKQQLRDEATRRIGEIPPEQRIVLDAQIATHVTHTPFWSDSEIVMGYVALDDEVDLQAIFRTAHREGKAIALPRIDAGSDVMEFRQVREYPASLERHPLGFLQPSAVAPVVSAPLRSIILVPGRMFDRAGYRIGRGRGYYDRYLSHVPAAAVTVGIGYAVQLVQTVPRDPADVPLQIVVTDSESCFCRRPQEN